MIIHNCESGDQYRWGVSTLAEDDSIILLHLESDECLFQRGTRIRLTPEDARDIGVTLLAYSQDIELNKHDENNSNI